MQIESRVIQAQPSTRKCFSVLVDSALGFRTTFTFSWVNTNPLFIRITDSNNQTVIATVDNSATAAAFQCAAQCMVSVSKCGDRKQ